MIPCYIQPNGSPCFSSLGGVAHQTSSPVTVDHDDLFELPPCGEAVAYSVTRSLRCRTTVVVRHSRMGFPALPQLSSAAELFLINLVAHHDPKPNAQFARRCDPGLAHSFLDELAPVEAFQFRVFPYRMHHRFGP